MSYSVNSHRSTSALHSASRRNQSQVVAAAATERLSGRQIDFCVLALCSCALTLMCHQALNLGYSPSGSASSVNAPSVRVLTQLDFNIKSGLVATQEQEKALED